MKIALVACRPHRYAGRMLAPGETFYVRGLDDARVLKAIGAAKDAPPIVRPPASPPAPLAPPPPVDAPVVVDPSPAPSAEEPPPERPAPEPSEPAPEGEGRRRRYRRRDLEADDAP